MSDSITMHGHERRLMTTKAYRLLTAHVIAPYALQGSHPHGRVLEVGAGVGALADHLLAVTPDLEMVVTDVDPEMCSMATATLRPHGPRVAVEQADANSLPFADDTFDFVLSVLMLHHTGDWRQTLREAIRVMRPGGRLVGFDVVAGAPLHRGRRAPTLLARGELGAFLPGLEVVDVLVRPALGPAAVRFVATKR